MRYADRIVDGKGNDYNEPYAGLSIYFYGQKLKWQTGLEYDDLRDDAYNGGEHQSWEPAPDCGCAGEKSAPRH